jgi:hypothetical protein
MWKAPFVPKKKQIWARISENIKSNKETRKAQICHHYPPQPSKLSKFLRAFPTSPPKTQSPRPKPCRPPSRRRRRRRNRHGRPRLRLPQDSGHRGPHHGLGQGAVDRPNRPVLSRRRAGEPRRPVRLRAPARCLGVPRRILRWRIPTIPCLVRDAALTPLPCAVWSFSPPFLFCFTGWLSCATWASWSF